MAKTNDKKVVDIRPPVVGILGHIDHGKSTLIDYIRKSNITASEAGGITQHVRAFEVIRQKSDPSTGLGAGGRTSKITFLDTPGHEAFKSLRTRGASVADIAVLIVSAEDGVKPQTLEVLKYIEESSLPYLVAITKIDKPSADPMRARQSLAENGVLVEGYGGNVSVVDVSAKTGQGVEEFLDMIELMAEMENLSGDADLPGSGVIIESNLDQKRGIAATGVVKDGTVRRGMFAACGSALAPIRFLLDGEGKTVEELSFSSPVRLIGWDKLPPVGEEFRTFLKKDEALKYIKNQEVGSKKQEVRSEPLPEGVISLPIIVKADTTGSLEAIESELGKLSKERILPKIIFAGVGTINENDIKLAISTPGTVVLGFHTKTDSRAEALAERSKIEILTYSIIYELTDKIVTLLTEREPRIQVEESSGSAKVLKLFNSAKGKQVLGARVVTGTIGIGNNLKIIRRESEIGRGKVRELQQAKIAAEKIEEGNEFGAMIESKVDIAPGDMLEAITLVTK